MRFRSLRLLAVGLIPLALVAAACSDDDDEATEDTTEETVEETTTTAAEAEGETIVDIAAGNPDFSTLVEAVTAAGLGETLAGDGPFTVFAPTNDAFAALPEGTLDTLLADPQGALTDVLTLHVVEGEVPAADAVGLAGQCATTLGGDISVAQEGENLLVGGATVVQTDIEASNGIIHVIDSVIAEADCAG